MMRFLLLGPVAILLAACAGLPGVSARPEAVSLGGERMSVRFTDGVVCRTAVSLTGGQGQLEGCAHPLDWAVTIPFAISALAGQPEHLWRATRDYLHQDYRRPAMPESLALVDRLRADGVAAVVSGAGPTVLAFSDGLDTADTERLLELAPTGWTALPLAIDLQGARLA